MLDPRFPAECALLFAAISLLHGEPSVVSSLAERTHADRSTVVRQLAKLRSLGAIVSTRGNHSLTFTLQPPSSWKSSVGRLCESASAPSESARTDSDLDNDLMPPLPNVNNLPVPPTRRDIASAAPCLPIPMTPANPTADASLSKALEVLNACTFWKNAFTIEDLRALAVEFPQANIEGLAYKFVRKYGKSQRAWPKGWARAKEADWPNRFWRHLDYHGGNTGHVPRAAPDPTVAAASAAGRSAPSRRWPAATASEREVAYATARLRLRSEGKNESALKDQLEDYARLIYEGKLT